MESNVTPYATTLHDTAQRAKRLRVLAVVQFPRCQVLNVECKRTALWCRCSTEFLGESDEKPFRPADVAEPIRVFMLDNFPHELRAAKPRS